MCARDGRWRGVYSSVTMTTMTTAEQRRLATLKRRLLDECRKGVMIVPSDDDDADDMLHVYFE